MIEPWSLFEPSTWPITVTVCKEDDSAGTGTNAVWAHCQRQVAFFFADAPDSQGGHFHILLDFPVP